MPNYGYHLARAEGGLISSFYQLMLPLIVRRKVKHQHAIPIDVFSYSSERRLAEQVASIRSFLRFAGRPSRFVVVSDGSHSHKSVELLRRVDECVAVERVPAPSAGCSESLA